MCGRFTLYVSPEVLAKVFSLKESIEFELRYNIAPSQNIAVIRSIDGQNQLSFQKWGLIPSWSKDATHPMINARSETVHEKPTFRHAIKHNRCIIPASGFYEWKSEDDHKQPYYIRLLNSSIMGFAGIWERWKTEDGDGIEIETCCILTTNSNDLMEPIHSRMPVILPPEEYGLWLNHNVHHPIELQRLYQPYPSDLMVVHPVPNLVNNPRFDGPACILQM